VCCCVQLLRNKDLVWCWFAAGKVNSHRLDHNGQELTVNSHGLYNSRRSRAADESNNSHGPDMADGSNRTGEN
jgi:hypothetical protein